MAAPDDDESKLDDVEQEEECKLVSAINENHKDTVCHQLSLLFDNKGYSDITFKVEGEEFHAHKVILATACPFFDTMFKSKLCDSKVVEIKTFSQEIFVAVLKFIYTGCIWFKEENAELLLEVSDLMSFSCLKNVMVNYFLTQMDETNVLGFYNMAKFFSAQFLREQALEYSLEKFIDVVKQEEFLSMSKTDVVEYLGHAHINARTEDEIFQAAIAWIFYNSQERVCYLPDLLEILRLEDLSSETLLPIITSSNEDLKKEEASMDLLQAVFRHRLFGTEFPKSLTARHLRTRAVHVPAVVIMWAEKFLANPGDNCQSGTIVHYFHFEYLSFLDEDAMQTENFNLVTTTKESKCLNVLSSKNGCVIDNALYFPGEPKPGNQQFLSGIYKYDASWDKLEFRPLPGLENLDVVMINGEKDEIDGPKINVFEVVKCKATKYLSDTLCFSNIFSYLYNKNYWVKPTVDEETTPKNQQMYFVKNNKFKSCIYRKRIYLFGVGLLVNTTSEPTVKDSCTHIVSFDTATNQNRVHRIQLPYELTRMKACSYRCYIILCGREGIFVVDMSKLQDDYENGISACEEDQELANLLSNISIGNHDDKTNSGSEDTTTLNKVLSNISTGDHDDKTNSGSEDATALNEVLSNISTGDQDDKTNSGSEDTTALNEDWVMFQSNLDGGDFLNLHVVGNHLLFVQHKGELQSVCIDDFLSNKTNLVVKKLGKLSYDCSDGFIFSASVFYDKNEGKILRGNNNIIL